LGKQVVTATNPIAAGQFGLVCGHGSPADFGTLIVFGIQAAPLPPPLVPLPQDARAAANAITSRHGMGYARVNMVYVIRTIRRTLTRGTVITLTNT
jgi:hypothetical protein